MLVSTNVNYEIFDIKVKAIALKAIKWIRIYSYANKLFLNLLEPDRIDSSLVSFTIIHTIFSSEKEKKKSSEININNKSILVSIKLKSKLHDMISLSFRPSGSFIYTGR